MVTANGVSSHRQNRVRVVVTGSREPRPGNDRQLERIDREMGYKEREPEFDDLLRKAR